MTGRNVVESLHRRIELNTPPSDYDRQRLLVPAGSTDRQVLGWAAQVLDPASFEELRRRIVADAHAEALDLDQQQP